MAKNNIEMQLEIDSKGSISTLKKVDRKVEDIGRSANKSSSGMSNLTSSFKGMIGPMLGIGAAVGGFMVLKNTLNGMIDEGDRLHKLSYNLNMTTDAIQGLEFAAGQAGLTTAEFDKSMLTMSRRIAFAKEGTGAAASAFKRLGVNVKELNKLSTDDQLKYLADKLNSVENKASRGALQFEIFGLAGQKMGNMLGDGSAGLENLTDQFDALGKKMSKEQIENAAAYKDAIGELDVVFTNFTNSLAPVIPLLTKMTNGMQTLLDMTHTILTTDEEPTVFIKTAEQIHAAQKEVVNLQKKVDQFSKKPLHFKTSLTKYNRELKEAQEKLDKLIQTNSTKEVEVKSKAYKSKTLDQAPDSKNTDTLKKEIADKKKHNTFLLEQERLLQAQKSSLLKRSTAENFSLTHTRQETELEELRLHHEQMLLQYDELGLNKLQIQENYALKQKEINDRYKEEPKTLELDSLIGGVEGEKPDFMKDSLGIDENFKENFQSNVASPLQTFFTSIADGSATAKDAFKSMVGSMLGMIQKLCAELLVTIVLKKIAGLLGGASGTANSASNATGSLAGSSGGFSSGMSSQAPMMAAGGIVGKSSGGSLINIGEGGQNEAVVPLPNGRSIPIDMPKQNSGGVVINNNITVENKTNDEGLKISQMISSKIRESLLKEKRHGGLLHAIT